MKPNYYPGRPPEEQPEPIKWEGKTPTKEELRQILADQDAWWKNFFNRLSEVRIPPHDLSRAILKEQHLSDVNLREAKLVEANFNWANLSGADFREADAKKADFDGANLNGANFSGANLHGAGFRRAMLEGVNFFGSDISDGSLRLANISGASLVRAKLLNTDLRGAVLINADLSEVGYNRKTKFLGSNRSSAYGSPKFLAFARHQEFLEELRQTKRGKVLYWIWNIFADCGRTPWYWLLWSVFFCLGFAGLYWYMQINGTPAFHLGNEFLPNEFFTMLYFSVVTFTTLGFGDVTPVTLWARVAVMTEVVIGYAMLGGLISIFATLITRRN